LAITAKLSLKGNGRIVVVEVLDVSSGRELWSKVNNVFLNAVLTSLQYQLISLRMERLAPGQSFRSFDNVVSKLLQKNVVAGYKTQVHSHNNVDINGCEIST